MAELTYRGSRSPRGIAQEMERDPNVVLIGEDVGAAGGVFKLTEGLFDEFGPERVRDTPISEQAIVGAAMGAAMTGLRPIAELMFCDFFAVAWDMVANQIAKTRYMTDGQVSLPLVLRTANGAGPAVRRAAQPERRELGDGDPRAQGRRAVDAGRRGRADGRGHPRPGPGHLLRAQGAVRDQGRGPRRRASSTRSGTAARRPRRARTPRSSRSRRWCPKALEAADRLAAEHGVDAEVIDLRSLVPLDTATILASVEKTSRLFTVEENPRLCGWGAEIASIVADEGFYSLDAPIVRITTPHIPLPSAAALEDLAMPSVERIVETVQRRLDDAARLTAVAEPVVASWAPGGWARRWPSGWPAAGVAGRPLQPDARTGRPRSPTGSGRPVGRRPAEAAARADVVHHDARRRRGRATRCTPARTALLAGVRARRRVRGRHEHRRARHDPGRSPPAVRARRRRPPRRAGLGQRRPRRDRRADDHGRRRRRPTSSGPGRSSSQLARRVFHLGPLGTGAAMKLAVNTADLRAQRGRRRGPRPRRGSRHRPRARLRRARRQRRRRAVRRLQARRLRRARTRRRSRSRSTSPPRTCA